MEFPFDWKFQWSSFIVVSEVHLNMQWDQIYEQVSFVRVLNFLIPIWVNTLSNRKPEIIAKYIVK